MDLKRPLWLSPISSSLGCFSPKCRRFPEYIVVEYGRKLKSLIRLGKVLESENSVNQSL
jgi:hypothetical protein